MPNTAVPICPFLSADGKMKPCLDNCPLNIKGECSIKIIAEKLAETSPGLNSGE